jgi:hypothetical protein
VRRNAALYTLIAAEIAVAALSAAFHLKARAQVLEAFRAYETEVPPLTALALAPWFLPSAVGIGVAMTACALALPLRRSQRTAVISLGLVIPAFALIFAVLAAFAPIFSPA